MTSPGAEGRKAGPVVWQVLRCSQTACDKKAAGGARLFDRAAPQCPRCGAEGYEVEVVDRRVADELAGALGDLAAELIDVVLAEGRLEDPYTSPALAKANAALSRYPDSATREEQT